MRANVARIVIKEGNAIGEGLGAVDTVPEEQILSNLGLLERVGTHEDVIGHLLQLEDLWKSCRSSGAIQSISRIWYRGVVFNGNQSFQRPVDNGDVSNYSVNGGMRQTNAFLIDGAPMTLTQTQQVTVRTPI